MIYLAYIALWWAARAYAIPGECLTRYRADYAACAVYAPGTLARRLCEAEAQGRYEGCIMSERAAGPTECDACADCCPPADYNQDGGVDGSDVEAFFLDWGDGIIRPDENGCAPTDYNGDGVCTECDARAFLDSWAWGG